MSDQKSGAIEEKAQPNEAKTADGKPADPKGGAAEDKGKTSDVKTGDAKTSEDKTGDAKSADGKPADPKAGELKGAGSEAKPAAKDAEKGEKAKEAGLKHILDQIKAELGTTLKDLPAAFSPRDLSVYSNEAIATPAGTRAAVDRLTLIDQVLLNGTFPVALTFADGDISPVPSSISIREEFRRLGQDDRKAISSFFLQERLASFPNAGTTYVQAFESEALAKLHKSEAMHMVFDAQGKAMVKGVKLGLGTSLSKSSSSEQSSRSSERNLHVSMVREEVILNLRLPLSLIEVPAERQRLYENLVAAYEKAETALPATAPGTARTELRLDLLESIEQLGLLVPTRYLLGGRLTSHTCEQTSETLEASTRIGRQQFAALISGETPVATGGTVGGGRGSAEMETRSRANATHSRAFALECTGGDSTLSAKPQEWVRSLSNSASIAVIGWQDPVLVWAFFAPALRERYKAALPIDFLISLFKQRVQAGLKRQEWTETLEQEATWLTDTYFHSKTLDVKEVSKSFGLRPDQLPGSKSLPLQERDTDYALIGSRVRENRIRADDGHVITYFAMRTNFDPPGRWNITNGGLLKKEVLVQMESETQCGMHWFIESAQARKQDFTPPATLASDILCLRAFELYGD